MRQVAGLMLVAPAMMLATGCTDTEVLGDTVSQSERDAIVNGVESEYPWIGFLGSCTATLIGRRTALTAGHCAVDGARVTYCYYPYGNSDSDIKTCSGGTVHRHPNFVATNDDSQWSYDVSVIKLDRDFTSLTGIVPLRIGDPPHGGELINVGGYGCNAFGGNHTGPGIGQQRIGNNNISSVDSQIIKYNDISQAYNCYGDSGGLMGAGGFGSDCQIGVLAASPTNGGSGDYKASRIDTKLPWILQTAADPSVLVCFEAICGDGFCQYPETCSSCSADCHCAPPPQCGDGQCNGSETSQNCPSDCAPGCSGTTSDCCGVGACYTPTQCQHFGC